MKSETHEPALVRPPQLSCLDCRNKACRSEGKDCTGLHEELVSLYREPETRDTYVAADRLVAGGRAGSLSRLEEIAELCLERGWSEVALAYCFGLEGFARQVQGYLRQRGLEVGSYRCTLGGVREDEVQPGMRAKVNCDPLGQALAINRSSARLVVEIGLCLGHDLLFHQHLAKPLTVLLVKDRRFGHCPQRFFENDPG